MDLQSHGTEKNEGEGPKDKKPAAKNRPLERPSLINLNHGSKSMTNLVVRMTTWKKSKGKRT